MRQGRHAALIVRTATGTTTVVRYAKRTRYLFWAHAKRLASDISPAPAPAPVPRLGQAPAQIRAHRAMLGSSPRSLRSPKSGTDLWGCTRSAFLVLGIYIITNVPTEAAQFTLQCKLYPTPDYAQNAGKYDDGGRAARLKQRSMFLTIDPDQKKYSDGTTVSDLKEISDKYITLQEHSNSSVDNQEYVDRYTGKYKYVNTFTSKSGATTFWDISIDGDCQKVDLRPMPTAKF